MMFTEAILVVAAATLTVTGLKVLIYNTAAYARLDASQNPGSLDGEDGFYRDICIDSKNIFQIGIYSICQK